MWVRVSSNFCCVANKKQKLRFWKVVDSHLFNYTKHPCLGLHSMSIALASLTSSLQCHYTWEWYLNEIANSTHLELECYKFAETALPVTFNLQTGRVYGENIQHFYLFIFWVVAEVVCFLYHWRQLWISYNLSNAKHHNKCGMYYYFCVRSTIVVISCFLLRCPGTKILQHRKFSEARYSFFFGKKQFAAALGTAMTAPCI